LGNYLLFKKRARVCKKRRKEGGMLTVTVKEERGPRGEGGRASLHSGLKTIKSSERDYL
jgi:hypothetical protein